MKRVVLHGLAVLLLVLSTLPAAHAAQKPVPRDHPSLLAAAWTWIVLHAFPADPPARMEKAGCDIDPNGGKVVCAPVTLSDEGCDIDPNGSR
jgi:hypothetical protein